MNQHNMNDTVELAVDGALARVTLRHPGKLNAMSRAMWRQLRQVFERIQAMPALRCVLMAGEGGAFCAGGDISEYPAFRFDESALRAFHEEDVWGGLSAVLNCDLPIVAQIEGACMGAGVEIACCCDIRLAGQGARFGAPIARLGFPMAPRELALVLREAGAVSVREMLLEAAVVNAQTMAARGFLTRVLPDDAVAGAALAAVERLRRLAPQAAQMNKRTIRALNPLQVLTTGSFDAMDLLLEQAYGYADSAEHREGITAFLDKRQPDF